MEPTVNYPEHFNYNANAIDKRERGGGGIEFSDRIPTIVSTFCAVICQLAGGTKLAQNRSGKRYQSHLFAERLNAKLAANLNKFYYNSKRYGY